MEAVGVIYYTKQVPITVADVNLCVVGIKQCLSSKFKKKYEKNNCQKSPPPKKKRCSISICRKSVCKVRIKRNENC